MTSSASWLGELPAHWQLRRLGTLGAFAKGSGGTKEDNREAGLPVVRYGDLYTRFGPVITRAHSFIDDDAATRYTPLGPGTVVFAASGEDPEQIGKSALSLLAQPAYVGGDTVLFFPERSEVEPLFLAYALESRPLRALKAIRSTGFTVVHISAGRLKTLPIPLPPLFEQRLIADFLDRETARIDELIVEQQRLVVLLAERRFALIVHAVSRGLDSTVMTQPSGLRWCESVPAHWTVANIRKYATMKTGHTPSRTEPAYWADCEIPWFTLADVWQLRDGKQSYLGDTTHKISELGLANSAAELLPAGTVVLSRTASVGFTGIMPVPMATSQDFWNWIPGQRLEGAYLMWVFRAMRQVFASLMIGSTHKTIYQPTAAAIRIPVPPLEEQREIVSHLEHQTGKIDALVAETERLIELAQERRVALITAAVTGQIDVRSAA